jgi:hypothetical protein
VIYRRKRKDREKFIGIQIADDEKELIARAAEIFDESVSEYCRRVLIHDAIEATGDGKHYDV